MSTYSPILRTELIGDGQQPGAWGATTNSNFQYIFEAAIAGYVAVTVSPTANNQVLTYTNGPSSNSSLDQTVYGILKLNTGTLSANFNIFAPPVSKTYIIWNNTSYTATFYNSTVIGNTTAAGSGITIPAGAKVWIWSDGTNFWGNDTVAGNLSISGNLTVAGTSTFTGIPSGPTAAAGTNTTQLATTAFVTTAVSNAFPSGTRLVFAQAAAPTGWTQDTSDTANNRMMRVVSSTGGGTGGTASPILMDVVPSHTHTVSSSGTTGGQSADHSHSGTTDTRDLNHTHYYSGTTGGMNAGNPHNHYQGGRTFDDPSQPLQVQAGSSAAIGNQYTASVDINHGHDYSGNTGYMNQNVNHAHNFATGGVSNGHTHDVTVTGTTAANGSASNWEPRYNNVIICQKN
jgi:hypothetical protein